MYHLPKSHPINKDRQAIERHVDRVEWIKSFARAAQWYAQRHNIKSNLDNIVKAIEHGQFYTFTINTKKDGFKMNGHIVTAPWSHA